MMCFFLPLATLSLAEVTAIFYTAPLIISVMSVPLFGEKLGIFRIGAVLIGFVGVLFIVAPGTSGFELTYIMPLFSAVSYAAFQLITRYLRNEAPVIGMVAVQNMIYLAFGTIGVLLIMLFQPIPGDDSVSQFLLREWNTPQGIDFGYLLITGTIVLLLAFASTNIYSNLEATFIAPFEYVAMPTAVLWGIVFFGEWPSLNAWMGIILIISGGLLMIYRESKKDLHVGSDIRMRAAATYSETEETRQEN
jgi:drug/metabolite transporter (DMT)-like permease